MTAPRTIVTMRVPVSAHLAIYIQFDPEQPVDFAPLLNMEWRTNGAPVAPLFLKPLKENGAGAPLLHSAPTSSQEWRNSPHGEFLGDLEQAREALANRSAELARLDAILAPAWAEEKDLRAGIMATHERRDGVVFLDTGRAPERAPLFHRLSEISKRWGKQKAERAAVNSHVRSLERDIARLTKLHEAEKRKRAHG